MSCSRTAPPARPGRRALAFADLAEERISAEGSFASTHRTYSYGAHAAHVAVDPRTGAVEVIDYVAVEDVGRIINPATLHGQTVGAIVQGLGGVFLEHLVYDEAAQLLTGSLADYLLPTASDFPVIRAVALEDRPAPHNPLGAKGAGEGGIIPVGGVIANAIAAALRPLGVEPRELPLSPPRLWALIDAARERGNSSGRQSRLWPGLSASETRETRSKSPRVSQGLNTGYACSISAFCYAPSASGVCSSRGGNWSPRSRGGRVPWVDRSFMIITSSSGMLASPQW